MMRLYLTPKVKGRSMSRQQWKKEYRYCRIINKTISDNLNIDLEKIAYDLIIFGSSKWIIN